MLTLLGNLAYYVLQMALRVRLVILVAVPVAIVAGFFALRERSPFRLVVDLGADSPIVDPRTGQAVSWGTIWFAERADGSFELYDRAGDDPRTGNPLSPLDTPEDRARVAAWLQQLREESDVRARSRADSLIERASADRLRLDSLQRQIAAGAPQRRPSVGQQRGSTPSQASPTVLHDEAAAREVDARSSEVAAVEALASAIEGPQPRFPEAWLRELTGKSVQIEFTATSRSSVAAYLSRLRGAGVRVRLTPIVAGRLTEAPFIEYSQGDINAANALNAMLGDITRFDLNSTRAAVPLRIVMP